MVGFPIITQFFTWFIINYSIFILLWLYFIILINDNVLNVKVINGTNDELEYETLHDIIHRQQFIINKHMGTPSVINRSEEKTSKQDSHSTSGGSGDNNDNDVGFGYFDVDQMTMESFGTRLAESQKEKVIN